MPSSFAGLTLRRTPNARHQAMRRRVVIACALGALALASGVVGSLVSRPHSTQIAETGPFSYFPTQ